MYNLRVALPTESALEDNRLSSSSSLSIPSSRGASRSGVANRVTVRHVALEVVFLPKGLLAVWALVGLNVAVSYKVTLEVELTGEASRTVWTLEREVLGSYRVC